MMGFGGFFGILLIFDENPNGPFFGCSARMWSAKMSTSHRNRRDGQDTIISIPTERD